MSTSFTDPDYELLHQDHGQPANFAPKYGYQTERSGLARAMPQTWQQHPQRSRRWRDRVDWSSLLLVLSIWALLVATVAMLVFTTFLSGEPTSSDGVYMTSDEIAGAIALSTAPSYLALLLNDVLVERCWRRIELFALGRHPVHREAQSSVKMSWHVRAANFSWWLFLKRAWKYKSSKREFCVLISWLWLRWGAAAAIASTQLSVDWQSDQTASSEYGTPLYRANHRLWWILCPPVFYAIAVFGPIMFWLRGPWKLFSGNYDDQSLWQAYQPFLDTVQGGSLATIDEVADQLEESRSSLAICQPKMNKSGMQFISKLEGVWFPVVGMWIPPTLAFLFTYFKQNDREVLLRSGLFRFAFHYTFLGQNIMYMVALDFVIWNLSLEGLCRSSSRKGAQPKKPKHLFNLGNSAGIPLFFKICRQRLPWRAVLWFWLFGFQAFGMHFLTGFYIFCVQVLSYGPLSDRRGFYDPYFWVFWVLLTGGITMPLFAVWLLWPFQAPICDQDRWRWAKVNELRFTFPDRDRLGYYGIQGDHNGTSKACIGVDTTPFTEYEGEYVTY